jgi:thiol:disulfide interchange protein DsbD
LGLVSVFLVLAVLIVALKWLKWGEQFSNPYFAWGAVIVFVAMAAGLLGLFNVRLPTGVYSLSPRHDTYAGNFLLGALTAVLSTPCTAPLFPSLLLFAASQPVALGVLAMFMVGVGMASPYVLLSAFPELARRFPRTGPFSELVKQMMAFLLLGAAAYFAGGRLFAWPHFWWLVVAVGAAAAVFLVVRTLQLTRRPVAIAVSSVIALALVAGPLWWTISLLGATWRPFDAQVFERERQAGRVVLVKFTANWCLNCQYLEGTVFRDERVVSAIRRNGVIAMKADLTHEGAPGNALLAQITPSGGIPLTAIFTPHRPKPILLGGTFTTPSLLKELARATGG